MVWCASSFRGSYVSFCRCSNFSTQVCDSKIKQKFEKLIEIYFSDENNNTVGSIESTILCIRNAASGNLLQDDVHGLTTLILLFVLQFFIALGLIGLHSLAFSYLDDNVEEHEAPALIASALAAKFWGMQMGSLTALAVEFTSFGWFFGWFFLSPLLFILGILAILFPKRFLTTVVRQAANRILESSTNSRFKAISAHLNSLKL
jgi:MFS family permease